MILSKALVRAPQTLVALALSMGISTAKAQELTAEDAQLEARLQRETQSAAQNDEVVTQKRESVAESVQKIRSFQGVAQGKTPRCVDATKKVIDDKYVLSFDEKGAPCRIYDLSFPNLQAFIKTEKSLQIPLRRYRSAEYLGWLDGSLVASQKEEATYRKNFNARRVAQSSWLSKLSFSKTLPAVVGSQSLFYPNGIPLSFTLADLKAAQFFRYDERTARQLQELSVEMKSLGDDEISAELMDSLQNPKTLLSQVRFNWNDVEKVYEVALEGGFLPIKGPVILADFQTQYRMAINKMIRSILSSVMVSMSRSIPNPTVSAILEVVVQDTFSQVEMMYSYQMLQLEEALRRSIAATQSEPEISAVMTRGLNLVYGQRADLFSNYIVSVIQGKEFDWTAFEKMGRSARYTDEKQRDISMANLNSRLVLEKNCQVDIIFGYFATCTINQKKMGLYSLLSERKIFTRNEGATRIFNFERPYEAAGLRAGAWALSVGLRVVGLPIARSLVQSLNEQLLSYRMAGVLDEAFMRSPLSLMVRQGTPLTADDQQILKWMYIQNMNLFLPHSVEAEQVVINANKKLIGLQ